MEEKVKEKMQEAWDKLLKEGYSTNSMPTKQDMYFQGWKDAMESIKKDD